MFVISHMNGTQYTCICLFTDFYCYKHCEKTVLFERENEKNMFCDFAFSFLGVFSGAFLLCKAVSFKIQILCFCTNESKWLTGYYGPKTIIKIMKHRIQKHICRKKYYCLGPYSPIISDFVCDGRPIGQNKCYLNVTRESMCLILAKKRDKMKIFALEFLHSFFGKFIDIGYFPSKWISAIFSNVFFLFHNYSNGVYLKIYRTRMTSNWINKYFLYLISITLNRYSTEL